LAATMMVKSLSMRFVHPTEKLKSGFKMLDTNSDEVISKKEWDEFLRVHGFEKKSESQ
jgi:Ca2+-binding EF-hand superfamily protein